MEKNVYVVYDKLADRWNDPMLLPSSDNDDCDKILATSVVRDMRNKDSFVYKNADDLDLYHIGSYDDKTGDYKLLKTKRLVFHYSSLKGE